jgi:RND family efflux transporter MFP subunit
MALLAAVVISIAAVLGGLKPRQRQQAALADETRELAIPTVTIVSPAPGKPAVGLLLPAEVKPWIEAPIYARASGYLKRWYVDLGAHVKVGQLLAEIETPELDQELESSRSALNQAQAALALAKSTADRFAALVRTGAVSKQENDEKQSDLAFKTATVKASSANVRRLEELHSFARVTAPFAGTITVRQTDVGDLIAAGGAKELFRLAQTDKLRIYVRVPQTRALAVASGQSAELLVPEVPGKVFAAKVARTAGAIDADSRTLLVELEVDNARGEILAGSFAQVRFAETKGAAPLTLPGNTLLFRAEGPQVGVVRPDGRLELRAVKLGRDFGQTVEILAGVAPADQVILNPSDSLADGDTVRVVTPTVSETPGK